MFQKIVVLVLAIIVPMFARYIGNPCEMHYYYEYGGGRNPCQMYNRDEYGSGRNPCEMYYYEYGSGRNPCGEFYNYEYGSGNTMVQRRVRIGAPVIDTLFVILGPDTFLTAPTTTTPTPHTRTTTTERITSTTTTTTTTKRITSTTTAPEIYEITYSNGNGDTSAEVNLANPDPSSNAESSIVQVPRTELYATTNAGVASTMLVKKAIMEPSFNETFNVQNIRTNVISLKGFCGYPPYSNRQECITLDYYEDNLSQCEIEGGVILFGCGIIVLGIFIISANILLPLVVWRNPAMRTQYNYIKMSLAFADMLIGILLISTVLPNIFRIRGLTLEKAVQYVEKDTNSPSAVVTGSLLTTSMQASVLHLMFLSIERFTAIKAAFPKYFEYKLQPALLIHMMTLKEHSSDAIREKNFWDTMDHCIFAFLRYYRISLWLSFAS